MKETFCERPFPRSENRLTPETYLRRRGILPRIYLSARLSAEPEAGDAQAGAAGSRFYPKSPYLLIFLKSVVRLI